MSKNGQTFDSMQAAARGLKIPTNVLRWAKNQGCAAFRSNRIYGDELNAWLLANPPPEADDPKEQKVREEVRKLKMRNDREEGALIARATVAERIQRAAAELNAARVRSEAEHPMRFAAAAGDVAACRTVVRGIWDDIFTSLQQLGAHFEQ